VFTALGDSVNVAARLQDMSKRLGVRAVISEDVCRLAGLPPDALKRTDVEIRGHEKPMSVRTTEDPTLLAGLLEPQQVAAE
jgi:adenylate cyclase